jgi:hypothetical protein
MFGRGSYLRLVRLMWIALFAAATVPRVFGQGCAMCLTSAMSQGPSAVGALNHGVLILLVPPFLILVGIFTFTFLRR